MTSWQPPCRCDSLIEGEILYLQQFLDNDYVTITKALNDLIMQHFLKTIINVARSCKILLAQEVIPKKSSKYSPTCMHCHACKLVPLSILRSNLIRVVPHTSCRFVTFQLESRCSQYHIGYTRLTSLLADSKVLTLLLSQYRNVQQ